MKKIKNIIIYVSIAFSVILNSCDVLIEPELDNRRPIEFLLEDPARVEGLLLEAYNKTKNNLNFGYDAATDDAVTNDDNSSFRKMASEGWLSSSSPVSEWNNYDAIYYINLFLENLPKTEWPLVPQLEEEDYERFKTLHLNRMRGEAFALRAWFEFQLLQVHAGFDDGGQLLGFPIITKALTSDDNLAIPRGTFQECLDQIYADCDSAILLLPFAYKDSTNAEGEPDLVYNQTMGERYLNRLNGAIAKAIKSKSTLLAASPAFNANNDAALWQKAAELSGQLLTELGNGTFEVSPSGNAYYTKPYNDDDTQIEAIWRRDNKNKQSNYEQDNFPPSLFGKGRINPSQNLVDAFYDNLGFPISSSSVFDAADPYNNRDPRLNEYIIVNGDIFSDDTIFTYVGAPNNNGLNTNEFSTRTGYYMKKFVNPSVTIVGDDISGVERFTILIRNTELLLMYAEAANEAYGPTGMPAGVNFSARDVISAIRDRVGLPNDYVLTLNTVEDFRELVRNERRIELCFEGHRFWDIRRWDLKDAMKQSVAGMQIISTGANSYTYQRINEVEAREYEDYMIYGPIPYNETLKYDLAQNQGWD